MALFGSLLAHPVKLLYENEIRPILCCPGCSGPAIHIAPAEEPSRTSLGLRMRCEGCESAYDLRFVEHQGAIYVEALYVGDYTRNRDTGEYTLTEPRPSGMVSATEGMH